MRPTDEQDSLHNKQSNPHSTRKNMTGSSPATRSNWQSKLRRLTRQRWTWVATAALVGLALAAALTQSDLRKLLGTAVTTVTPTPGQPITATVPITGTGAVMFIENVGQFDPAARFLMYGGDRTIWLAQDAVWVMVQSLGSPQSAPGSLSGVSFKLSFAGANASPRLEPFNRLETHVSYFMGNARPNWRVDVPVWGGVRYLDLYPGVDLEVAANGNRWAWQLRVRDPQFNLAQVQLQVDGADTIKIESSPENGQYIRLTTAIGDFTLPLLTSYKAGAPSISQNRVVANPFVSPLLPPAARPSAIESIALASDKSDLSYSTFLGGARNDQGYGLAVDESGNVHVTGRTMPDTLPSAPGVFDATAGDAGNDVFVIKLNSTGSSLAYATFLGGSRDDQAIDIALAKTGHAYITGRTASSDFPISSTMSMAFGGATEAFVAKLNPDGSVAFATWLGGRSDDEGTGIAVDAAGNALVVGNTRSDNFPVTSGAWGKTFRGGASGNDGDIFVAKLNAAGSALEYATYVGGNANEAATGVAVDKAGNAYVTGGTSSTDFPTTPGSFGPTHGATYNTFVLKLNAAGSALSYATLLTKQGADTGHAIAVDDAGSAYVVGDVLSANLPVSSRAFDISYNGGFPYGDAFVVKLNPTGSALEYATYLGGSGPDHGLGIAIDKAGNAYIAGDTMSSDFPVTPGAFDTTLDGANAYIAKLDATGSGLIYATFLGGSFMDSGFAIALDQAGKVYITGRSDSSDFPTTSGAYDTAHNNNAFVTKLDPVALAPIHYSLSGRVMNAAGKPQVGAAVSDNAGRTVATDELGRYSFGALAAGTYSVTVVGPASTSRLVSLPPNAVEQNLVVSDSTLHRVFLPLVAKSQ